MQCPFSSSSIAHRRNPNHWPNFGSCFRDRNTRSRPTSHCASAYRPPLHLSKNRSWELPHQLKVLIRSPPMYLASALNLAVFEETIQGIPISRAAPFGRCVLGCSSSCSASVIWIGMVWSVAVDVVAVESPISTSSGGCMNCRMVSVDPLRRGINGHTTSAVDVLGVVFIFSFTVAEGGGSLSTLGLAEIMASVGLRFAPGVGVIFLITIFLGTGAGGVEVVEVREVTPSEVSAILTPIVQALEIAEMVLVLFTDRMIELLLPADEGPSKSDSCSIECRRRVAPRRNTRTPSRSPRTLVLVLAFDGVRSGRSVESRDLTEATEDLVRSAGLLFTLPPTC